MSAAIEYEGPFLRPEEAWKYLRIGKTRLYALTRQGELPLPVKFSSRVSVFRKADLDAFAARRAAACEAERRAKHEAKIDFAVKALGIAS